VANPPAGLRDRAHAVRWREALRQEHRVDASQGVKLG
jgi:hypothetical protein